MTDQPWLTITQLGKLFRTGAIKPSDVAAHYFSRIDQWDGRYHSFLTLTKERALQEAQRADTAFQSGSPQSLLQGIPYAAKDLFDVKGFPTTAGSRLLSHHTAKTDGAAIQRLSSTGMVLMGKTHTVQFAFGGVGINHDQGTPVNPWVSEPCVPGGSSSGSAVAVAAGMVPAALGTDTGGSVRIPASLCGIVGLKTTVGRISRSGVYPLSWTLDSVGVLTRSVEDAATLYQALQGSDPKDETTIGIPPHNGLTPITLGLKGLRLAFAENVFFDDLDPEIEHSVRETGHVFKSLGAQVESRALPVVDEAWASRKRALMIAAEACVINENLLKDHLNEMDPIIADRMKAGWKLSAPDYFLVLRQWKELQKKTLEAQKDIDALLVPTTMIPAKPIDEVDATPESYAEFNGQYLRNTSLGNILNLCAVSVPCGFTHHGLPIGLMIYAKPFQEDLALRIAYAYEQATQWHLRHPEVLGQV
jgi:aspartyl-tRNA(Asn)/glutamyl-tRNA(Gln) amidotransferase subunit A